jgi:methenyltetrahydromethanopterin cyclohydrolase
MLPLNERAWALCDRLEEQQSYYQVAVQQSPQGARLIDAGIQARGGLAAGLMLARICMADLAEVALLPGEAEGCPLVQVSTDHPTAACLASQYAGWQLKAGKYFAMGSGPMRAAAGHEKLFAEIGGTETARRVVGVLETSKLPTDEVVTLIAQKCQVPPYQVTLLAAPTQSLAGTLQIIARSVETCLHKLHELKFDVNRIRHAWGVASLPPVARDSVAAIGRTNDAILYGGQVTLWLEASDEEILDIGPKIPSSASKDYGVPFAELFQRVGGDFYQIDPMLFSPALVSLHNLTTGRMHRFGSVNRDLLRRVLA